MLPSVAAFAVTDLNAATFVAYNEDGSVNYEGVDAHCADLAKHKVPFAFINGTTGDSMSLSVEERKLLAEAWVAAGKKHGVTITNHVAAAAITDSRELAAHAERIGCAMIGAMPPFFFKSNSPAVIATWMKEIGAAAPNTPLYYYHFPAITGVAVDPLALIHAIEAVGVPTFRGMKFTEFNLWHYVNCVQHAGGRYDIAYGRDEAMLGGLASGAKASIGNAFCFAAGVCHRIRAAFFAGDLPTARLEQGRLNSVVNALTDARFGGNLLVTARRVMELKGVKLGPARVPHVPMTPSQTAEFEAELKRIDFFSWCD